LPRPGALSLPGPPAELFSRPIGRIGHTPGTTQKHSNRNLSGESETIHGPERLLLTDQLDIRQAVRAMLDFGNSGHVLS
jgi:hypothetical protein